MRKLLTFLFITLTTFATVAVGVLQNPASMVYAQDTIELNIGEAAKDADVVGTQNYNPNAEDAGFSLLIGRLLNLVVAIGALLLLFYLIWGGIEWITAAGDKGKIEKARSKIMQSIIGIIVLAGTIAIYMLIQQFLGFELIRFT